MCESGTEPAALLVGMSGLKRSRRVLNKKKIMFLYVTCFDMKIQIEIYIAIWDITILDIANAKIISIQK